MTDKRVVGGSESERGSSSGVDDGFGIPDDASSRPPSGAGDLGRPDGPVDRSDDQLLDQFFSPARVPGPEGREESSLPVEKVEKAPSPESPGSPDLSPVAPRTLPPDVAAKTRTVSKEVAGEAAAQPDKKSEVPPRSDAEVEASLRDPKERHAFARLRHQNSELERQKAELEKQLAERQKAELPAEEVAKYETTIRELEEKVGVLDLASSRAFKTKYDSPLNAMLGRAASLLVKSGLPAEDASTVVKELVSESTVERAQRLHQVAPVLASSVVNLLEDFDQLRADREAALRNWKDTRESTGLEARRLEKARAIELAEGLAGSVLDELASSGNPFFIRSGQDEEWNRGVEQREREFRGLLKAGDQATLARLVAEGLAGAELKRLYLRESEAREKLEAEVEEWRRLNPRIRGAPGASGVRPAPASSAPASDDQILDGIFDRASRSP